MLFRSCKDAAEIFGQKVFVAGDAAVVERGCPHVQQRVENESEVQKGEIDAVTLSIDHVLHTHVNAENPERFDQQVETEQQQQIPYKTPFAIFHIRI